MLRSGRRVSHAEGQVSRGAATNVKPVSLAA
jgi:hypothetical protein